MTPGGGCGIVDVGGGDRRPNPSATRGITTGGGVGRMT